MRLVACHACNVPNLLFFEQVSFYTFSHIYVNYIVSLSNHHEFGLILVENGESGAFLKPILEFIDNLWLDHIIVIVV